MGVRGPAPNPALDQRERKYGWTQLANVPTTAPAPKLRGAHTDRGLDLWARWWATPMATMWGEWDADCLERLLDLYEQHWAGDGPNLGEVRQLEDRFGLSPAGRRRLYWQVEGVDIPATTGDRLGHQVPTGHHPAAGGADDPRLRMVKGGRAG